MRHICEYRDPGIVEGLISSINKTSKQEVSLMEVCGGHTAAIHKFGIPSLLPPNIKLLSGPGCPVCVTDIRYIDHAIALSRRRDLIITTYGDLIRVPGSSSTLEQEMAKGHDIRVVYSLLNALETAKHNPHKKIVFLAIGFETTAPATAATLITASHQNINNFFILSAHKIMPPILHALIDKGVRISGYICPGHVSTITGINMYRPIVNKYQLGCVISGFEPADILLAVLTLVKQIEEGKPKVENQYPRAVKSQGNPKAREIMYKVFETRDSWWRGFGVVKDSGLALKSDFSCFNAELNIKVEVEEPRTTSGCICGEILKGLEKPCDCPLFAGVCHPSHPVGACMVSGEGTCNTYYRYRR